jgi:hypothetical protein
MKPVVHYPRDGEIYMQGQCGAHSVSSAKEERLITCHKCIEILRQANQKPA